MDNTKKIILVRHGQTEWNRNNRLNSRTDIPLNAEGVRAVSALAASMKISFDRVYASPLRRAYETAQILSKRFHLDIVKDNRLLEVDFGPFEGLSAKALEAGGVSESFDLWRRGITTDESRGAESLEDAFIRINTFIKDIGAFSGSTLIVTHGYIGRILLSSCILGLNIGEFRRIRLDNSTLTIVEWDEGVPQLILLNAR